MNLPAPSLCLLVHSLSLTPYISPYATCSSFIFHPYISPYATCSSFIFHPLYLPLCHLFILYLSPLYLPLCHIIQASLGCAPLLPAKLSSCVLVPVIHKRYINSTGLYPRAETWNLHPSSLAKKRVHGFSLSLIWLSSGRLSASLFTLQTC